MTQYTCAITIPVQYALPIREVQENYKSASWTISLPPHITLTPPGAAVATLDQAEQMLRSALRECVPFDVVVRGVGIFDSASHTVFAKVLPSEDLSRLQYAVHCASIGFVSKPNVRSDHAGNRFVPHITLSNKLNPMLARQIAEQLDEQRIDFTFCCDTVSLYQKEQGDMLWSESRRLSF